LCADYCKEKCIKGHSHQPNPRETPSGFLIEKAGGFSSDGHQIQMCRDHITS